MFSTVKTDFWGFDRVNRILKLKISKLWLALLSQIKSVVYIDFSSSGKWYVYILTRTVDSIKQIICSWCVAEASSAVLNVVSLSFGSSRNQSLHLDFVFLCLGCHSRLRQCCIFLSLVTFPISSYAWGFWSAVPVQAQVLEFAWLIGWFKLSVKVCGLGALYRFGNLVSSIDGRLKTHLEKIWSFGLILPALLCRGSVFNCWSFVLWFTWILQCCSQLTMST